jgi:hypothetical protein
MCLDWINYHQSVIWINGVIFCAKYKSVVPIKLGVLLTVTRNETPLLGVRYKRAPIFNKCNYVKYPICRKRDLNRFLSPFNRFYYFINAFIHIKL